MLSFLLADAITGFFVGIPVFLLIIIGIASIFWLWMLFDALVNPRLNGAEKLIWVLVVFFLHLIGALAYFVIGRGGSGTAGTPTV